MAPRKSRPAAPRPPPRTLVLDNGAETLKAGLVATGDTGDAVYEPRIIPNCIARDRKRKVYVASDLAKCRDFGEIAFRRPVEKGYIVNWEAQKEVWDHEFFDSAAPTKCDPSETRLVLTEQPNALPVLQSNCDQIVFEEYQFTSYYRGIGPVFNAYHDVQDVFQTPRAVEDAPPIPAEILLLIDSGYSSTTVTPIFRGRPLQSGIRRLDVGGKLLTNYLTRLLSLRHYDMRNDAYIVNEIKESACYVSHDFEGDLDKTWKGARGEQREAYLTGAGIAKDYVLPDFHIRHKGIVRDYDHTTAATRARRLATSSPAEDILTLRNERFVVPEVLFNPGDIGIQQPGLADLVVQSLDALPVGLWPGLLANIVVVGGSVLFEGFVQRLRQEIMPRVPSDCVVRVARPSEPITSTWRGAADFARHEHANRLSVTKQEYEEHGQQWVARKFATGLGLP